MHATTRGRAWLLACSLVAGLALVPLAAAPAAAVPGTESSVFVNELHYDNASIDAGEFIEVAGPAGTDLAGWSVVLYNGSTPSAATTYSTTALTGVIPHQQGGYGTVVVDYPSDGIQNGAPDGLALVNGATVVQLLSYEGVLTAANGPAAGHTSTNIGVSQTGTEPIGSALGVTGTGTRSGHFTWTETEGANTKGAPNTGQTFDGEPPPPAPPTLSEIRIDQPGSDNDEYVELAGTAGTSLDPLTYVVLGDGAADQGSGVVEAAVDLTSQSIGSSGFFTVAESTFTLGTADLVTTLNFENADNVTHLLVSGFTGAVGTDLDTNDDGTLDTTPWASVVDKVALIESPNPPTGTEFHYGPPTVGPDGAAVPMHVFRCDAEWRIGAADLGVNDTPGAANACVVAPPPPVCGDPATFIHQIQGSGPTFDPAFGGTRSVEGVVTATMRGLNGYYVQEETTDEDANPVTSEGIFVFVGAANPIPVEVGQLVRVTGTVAEFAGNNSSQTQLTNSTADVCPTAGTPTVPTDVTFPLSSPTDLERYEGMVINLVDELVISEMFNYDRFGEVVVAKPLAGLERLFTPTAVVDPGPAAQALAAEYRLRRITIDDRNGSQNPATVPHPGNGAPFSLDNRFRAGDTVTGLRGVLDHTFGLYRVQPTQYGDYAVQNPRPQQPPTVGGNLQVASFNVLNYFLTLDQGDNKCGPARGADCRGADTETERQRQRAKILDALARLDADVVGLMEMENTPGVEPAADLVAGLNERLGAGSYAYIDTGVVGTDAIRLGFIYKPAAVRPAGDFAVLDSSVDPRFIDTRSRPMLTQTFDEVATGARVTVSVNHLKSKGSACAGDPDTGDGQGNCNLTRTAAAEAIVDFLAGDPTGSGDADHLVIGDLNAYDHEDPIRALESGGFIDQVKRYGGEHAYGFLFDGQIGYLDHALANGSLNGQVTGAGEWHINADEPDILDYNLDFGRPATYFAPDAYRSSDHDAVLVGLDLTPVTPARCYTDGSQSVSSYTPGKRANGTSVPPSMRNPARALGLSDPNPRDPYWVSLGLGGEIVLRFARPVHNNNGPAPDLRVVDAPDGDKGRTDAALVYGSADGQTWVLLGRVVGTGSVDLGSLPSLSYVKVVDDTTNPPASSTDGYDLDAVEVLTGCP